MIKGLSGKKNSQITLKSPLLLQKVVSWVGKETKKNLKQNRLIQFWKKFSVWNTPIRKINVQINNTKNTHNMLVQCF